MTLFDTFKLSSVPIQDEKEDIAIRDQIYRDEKYMHNENFSPSPKAYGRGYTFFKKMGYLEHGPLSDRLDARAEPIDHALFGHKSKEMIGLGYVNCNENITAILDKLDSEDKLE